MNLICFRINKDISDFFFVSIFILENKLFNIEELFDACEHGQIGVTLEYVVELFVDFFFKNNAILFMIHK